MKKLVIGISGASGMPIALHLLKILKEQKDIETHLVYTKGAEMTLEQESNISLIQLEALADVVYDNRNLGAAIASGTFMVDGMIVVPCSMKTVAGVAHGYSDNLLLRACDVMIKEKRPLVLAVREAPLSLLHLENLSSLARFHNVSVLPLVLSYYQHPKSIEDMELHLIAKMLSPFQIEVDGFRRWK